jgi:hypothetical protein
VVLVLDDAPARLVPGARPEARLVEGLSWPEALEILEREGVGADCDRRPDARIPVESDRRVPSMAL